MQQIFYLLSCCIMTFAALNILALIVNDYRLLSPEEQMRLKEGKTFWQWLTPEKVPSNIHYIEKGAGSNHVILVHGFRCNTYTWRHLMDPLAESGFHVWSIDLVGFGYSDKPAVDYNLELFLSQIYSFMDSQGIRSAHFIGNSMGGGISMALAILHSERVNSLSLISPLGYPIDIPLYVSIGKHFSMFWTPFLSLWMIKKALEQVVFDKATVSDEQVLAYAIPYYFSGGAAAALSTLRNFDNQKISDFSKRYSEIACPLFVLWGSDDTLIPMEHFRRFRKDFPGAKTKLIKECGHIPQEEKPEEIRDSIISFLRDLPSA